MSASRASLPRRVAKRACALRRIEREQLLELVDDDEGVPRGPPPARQELERRFADRRTSASLRSASGSLASWGPSARPRPRRGALPGVATIAAQPSGRAAITPARTNDVLPAPEGPMTARSLRSWSFCQRAVTSSSRPKKRPASSSVKDESPGYGLFSSTSRSAAAELPPSRTASSAAASSCAD